MTSRIIPLGHSVHPVDATAGGNATETQSCFVGCLRAAVCCAASITAFHEDLSDCLAPRNRFKLSTRFSSVQQSRYTPSSILHSDGPPFLKYHNSASLACRMHDIRQSRILYDRHELALLGEPSSAPPYRWQIIRCWSCRKDFRPCRLSPVPRSL